MFKFKVGDEVVTKEIIEFDNCNIINIDTKGKITHLDHTAETTQPYMVEFDTSNYPQYGNRWWVYESQIELIQK